VTAVSLSPINCDLIDYARDRARAINRNDTRAHARELDSPAFFSLADLSIHSLFAAPVIVVTVTGEEPMGGREGGSPFPRSLVRYRVVNCASAAFSSDRSEQISRNRAGDYPTPRDTRSLA